MHLHKIVGHYLEPGVISKNRIKATKIQKLWQSESSERLQPFLVLNNSEKDIISE